MGEEQWCAIAMDFVVEPSPVFTLEEWHGGDGQFRTAELLLSKQLCCFLHVLNAVKMHVVASNDQACSVGCAAAEAGFESHPEQEGGGT